MGTHKIEADDMVLVRLDHVSKGSWQARLEPFRRLNRL